MITGGNGADTITGGVGADTIDGGASADSIRYVNVTDATDTVTFDAADVYGLSVANFVVALTDAGAGVISDAAVTGTTLNVGDYFEYNTADAGGDGSADLGDGSAMRVIVIGETFGTFTDSDALIAAINAENSNADIAAAQGMILVYATAAGTYQMTYDADGATAGGETVIMTLTGIADGAAALTLSEANFAFYA